MASYRYEMAQIGDVVLFEDVKLRVCDSDVYDYQGCKDCFFQQKDLACSGIACRTSERLDRKPVFYKLIKEPSK